MVGCWLVSLDSQTDRQQHKTDRQTRAEYRRACRYIGRQKAKKSYRKSRNTDPPPKFQNVFPERTFAWNGGITQKIRIFDKKK